MGPVEVREMIEDFNYGFDKDCENVSDEDFEEREEQCARNIRLLNKFEQDILHMEAKTFSTSYGDILSALAKKNNAELSEAGMTNGSKAKISEAVEGLRQAALASLKKMVKDNFEQYGATVKEQLGKDEEDEFLKNCVENLLAPKTEIKIKRANSGWFDERQQAPHFRSSSDNKFEMLRNTGKNPDTVKAFIGSDEEQLWAQFKKNHPCLYWGLIIGACVFVIVVFAVGLGY